MTSSNYHFDKIEVNGAKMNKVQKVKIGFTSYIDFVLVVKGEN